MFIDGKLGFPQARFMVPLVGQKLKDKKWDDIGKLVPLYLYPDHCQVRKESKK